MIKFIIPAVIAFLIVLFWEKISENIQKKFKIKLNVIAIVIILIVLTAILALLYF
tara:strand:- start:1692 stop:1856 length:165 start_codon:yes stop_codon:yes gene_type:complete